MNREIIYRNIKEKESFLCIGLDSNIDKIPKHLLKYADPIFEFNKQIIDATHDLVIAFKPNIAFYESLGSNGWNSLSKTAFYIKNNYPEIFLIADAKRGDIGNTSKMYAKAFFENMPFDAITVAPYMGKDSLEAFLSYEDKWTIILALTSNAGAADFQMLNTENDKLFEKVLKISQTWASAENIMYVVGATKAEHLKKIRELVPEHFLLIPGIGAQGGNLNEVYKYSRNKLCGLIVNSSRNIIFAKGTEKFAESARAAAIILKNEMKILLEN